jgi:hypothetical protein
VARPGSALTPSGRPVALLRECGSTQDIVRVAADSNTVVRPSDTILVRERYF